MKTIDFKLKFTFSDDVKIQDLKPIMQNTIHSIDFCEINSSGIAPVDCNYQLKTIVINHTLVDSCIKNVEVENKIKSYATSFTSLFENRAIAKVFKAKNEVEAMVMAIADQQKDEQTRHWLNEIKNLEYSDFKDAAINCEIAIDAVEIKY